MSKNTAKQGHNYPILRNSSQLFLWQTIVRLIWNGNTLRFSSKSTIFKQKIHLNCPSTMKFKDRNVAHAHCSIWSWQLRARLELFLNLLEAAVVHAWTYLSDKLRLTYLSWTNMAISHTRPESHICPEQ